MNNSIYNYRIVASMSDYHASRHASFRQNRLLDKIGCIEYRLWSVHSTEESARKALAGYAAEDGITLGKDETAYSYDIWNYHIEENTIPEEWKREFDGADTLEKLAALFNEAESYSDFDCVDLIRIWCNFNEAEQVCNRERPDVYAETDEQVFLKLYHFARNGDYSFDKRKARHRSPVKRGAGVYVEDGDADVKRELARW